MPAASRRPQEMNPAKLSSLFIKQFELCKVKPGETVMVLSDLSSRREYVEAAFAAADVHGADIYEMCVNQVPSWTKVGVATVGKCKGTLDAARSADMIVCFHVPLFAKWLKEVRSSGTRVLMVIDSPDDLEQTMSPPGLKEAVLYGHDLYAKTREVRVLTDSGTDFTYTRGEYPVMSQYGYADAPGRFDHWGGGHIHTFPNEGSANGRVVIAPGDIIILPYCRYVVDPIELVIKDGFIRSIDGGLDAKLMRDWLDDNKRSEDDMDPYAISHLGWGLNPQARWYGLGLHGDDPERSMGAARAFAGNFLFSTGPNTEGGGKRDTNGHYDVPMRDCTVLLDNKTIIEKGRIVDPKMVVERIAI
jgi:2,5-dihydroxypyridine 5,6-dioxygenase